MTDSSSEEDAITGSEIATDSSDATDSDSSVTIDSMSSVDMEDESERFNTHSRGTFAVTTCCFVVEWSPH